MNTYYVTVLEEYCYTVRAESEAEAHDLDDIIETNYNNLHEISSVELKEEDVEE